MSPDKIGSITNFDELLEAFADTWDSIQWFTRDKNVFCQICGARHYVKMGDVPVGPQDSAYPVLDMWMLCQNCYAWGWIPPLPTHDFVLAYQNFKTSFVKKVISTAYR